MRRFLAAFWVGCLDFKLLGLRGLSHIEAERSTFWRGPEDCQGFVGLPVACSGFWAREKSSLARSSRS